MILKLDFYTGISLTLSRLTEFWGFGVLGFDKYVGNLQNFYTGNKILN